MTVIELNAHLLDQGTVPLIYPGVRRLYAL